MVTVAGDRLGRPNSDMCHPAEIHHSSDCCLLITQGLNYWADLIRGKLPLVFLGRANIMRNKCLNYNFVLSPSVSHCASLRGKKRQRGDLTAWPMALHGSDRYSEAVRLPVIREPAPKNAKPVERQHLWKGEGILENLAGSNPIL